MKKLALALVCLFSVAFFASCEPEVENPEPTIAFSTEEGYVSASQEMEWNTPFTIAFDMAANKETGKNLSTFDLTITNSTTTFTCEPVDLQAQPTAFVPFQWDYETMNTVDTYTIKGTVTDEAGKTASVEMVITFVENNIEPADFTFTRVGGNPGEGLEPFGLKWNRNAKEIFATIEPLEGVLLYTFTAEDWNNVNTINEKAAFFANAQETTFASSNFRGVSCERSQDYDFVIGTIQPDGTTSLLHITRGDVTTSTAGTTIVINGQAK